MRLGRYISASALKKYRICPRMFYYYIQDYRGTVPPFVKAGADIGKIVHEVIADYYNALMKYENNIDNETPRQLLRQVLARYNIEADRQRITNILRNFLVFETWRITESPFELKPVVVEKEYVNEELMLHGIIDAVFKYKNREKYAIIDWKTGSIANALDPDVNLQMAVYKLIFPEEADIYIVQLEAKNPRPEPVEPDVELVKKLVQEILEKEYFERRRGEHCKTCPYKAICEQIIENKINQILGKYVIG